MQESREKKFGMGAATVCLLVSLSLPLAGAAAETAENGLEPEKHNPYLVQLRQELRKRAASKEELQKLVTYVQQHPADPDGRMVLANAYNKLGMDALYANELETAWKLSPKSLLYLVGALKARAVTDDRQNYDRLVNEAFEKYKDDPRSLSKLSQLFIRNNQSDLAYRFMVRALELDPKDIQLRSDYCVCLLALDRYEELVTASRKLLYDPSTRALAYMFEGTAWKGLRQPHKALPLLMEAYRLAPGHLETAEAYVDALVSTGDYSHALQPALVALALQPPAGSNMKVYKSKIEPIIAKASSKSIEEGMAQIDRAMPKGTALAFFYFALGDLLDRVHKYRLAATCYNKGISVDAGYGRPYMRLGHDMELLGQSPEEVLKNYEQAALRTNNDQEVIERYQRMKDRMPAVDRDVAGKLKNLFNSMRYRS